MLDYPSKYEYQIKWSEKDGSYIGTCREFPSLSYCADSHNDAYFGICDLIGSTVREMIANREDVPKPRSMHSYSGKFQVRVSPELHSRLVEEASSRRVSLNQLIVDLLSASVCE